MGSERGDENPWPQRLHYYVSRGDRNRNVLSQYLQVWLMLIQFYNSPKLTGLSRYFCIWRGIGICYQSCYPTRPMVPCGEGFLTVSRFHGHSFKWRNSQMAHWGWYVHPHISMYPRREWAWLYPSWLCHSPPSCLALNVAAARISMFRGNRISQCEGVKKVSAWDTLATRNSFCKAGV